MNARLNRLFTGHTAGAYTLPAPVLAAHQAVTALSGPQPSGPARPEDVHDELVQAAVEAARTGSPLPDAAPLAAARARWAEHEARVSVLDGARQSAALQLPGAVEQHAAEILTGHLQPALDEIMAGALEAAQVLPADVDDRALMLADTKTRKVWTGLDELSNRYSLVRAAQHDALAASGQQAEDADEWAAYDDMLAAWPGWPMRGAYRGDPNPPWPTDPRQFLLWHAHHGTRFVALTITERNTRWHAKYDADLDHRRALHASAVATSGGTWVA